MSTIKMTLNGRPLKGYGLKDMLESALLELAIEKIESKISHAITEEEAGQITVELTGRNAGNLSVEVRGPQEIVRRAKAALA